MRPFGFAGACFLSGCGSVNLSSVVGGQRSTTSLSDVDLDNVETHLESDTNNAFEEAERVMWEGAPLAIQGTIEAEGDVDIYDLGPVVAGDRVIAELDTDETLDGAMALFDGDGTCLLVNDHRNVYLGRREPFVDIVAREPSDHCFLAVSATPGYGDNGAYTLLATTEPDALIPGRRPATVLLVFSGAQSVKIGSRPVIDVPSFDSGDIGPELDGLTEYITEGVVARVREDFAPFDVTILSTSEGATFTTGMSRLFFGNYDSALLGVAEGVDELNRDDQQEAIVFTDTFRAFDRVEPSVDEIIQAIANVASHEIGHLLGLVHTADSVGIMDVTASLSEILADQTFTRSPIYDLVFPIGFQDAVVYLVEAVGGDFELAFAAENRTIRSRLGVGIEHGGAPARSVHPFSSCSLECAAAPPDPGL